ncbi:hypothetical protein WJX77_011083 [Trebouxia sp. C0004]
MFYLAKTETTPAGSLKRPQDNSFLTQEAYLCSYGPQDNRSCATRCARSADTKAAFSREVFGIYGTTGVRVFLCFWHVKRSWLKNLHRKCPWSLQHVMFLHMKSHADALGPLDRAARASSSKCMTLLRKSCADHAEQTDFVAYFHKTWGHKPDEWVRGVRDVPHAQQDTTAACEGYHSAIKGNELAGKSRLQGRRVDWLLHLLWHEECC